ncbi:MAG: asparagine synthase (glutamine-hydrolyzing) [Rhodospirillaceae bacterium]|nr:asparagine synthase (glutamine-hydrolyzing) [Rhodospirillales bacterium]
MCGFVGLFDRRGGGLPPDDILVCATDRLAHRGPDAGTWWRDGPFFLGHRRLSIIGLEDGGQPMASADGRFVIAFNGEIYNFLELRAELARDGTAFRTGSDTEVLLAGFARWGEDVCARLEGMFAFSIVDRLAGSVFLARDRFGEKPLFVAEADDGTVAWASEVKALAALGVAGEDLDDDALAAYLSLNYVPGIATLLRRIRRLPAGSWRRYDCGGSTEGRYWRLPAFRPRAFASAMAAAAELRPLLDKSVAHTLRSDVPVGLFLSSGIDSALVGESAARQGRLTQAYCLDMEHAGYSEIAGARRVAQRLGLDMVGVPMGPGALEDFLALAQHADDPLADSSALAVWTLSRAAAQDVKVVIGGDGGDELFGGYQTYAASRWHGSVMARLPMALRRALAAMAPHLPVSAGKVTASYKAWRFLRAAHLPTAQAHFCWNGTWLPETVMQLLNGQGGGNLARLAGDLGLPPQPSLDELQAADTAEYLANDILAKVDRMTMAHSLECRAPLLNADIAAFATTLPAALRVPWRGQGKPVLRALAAQALGRDVAYGRKQGFSIPVHDWLRGPARALMVDLLNPASLAQAVPQLSPHAVARAMAAHLGGAQLGFEMWGLMILVAWTRCMRQGFAGGPIPPRPARRLELPAMQVTA